MLRAPQLLSLMPEQLAVVPGLARYGLTASSATSGRRFALQQALAAKLDKSLALVAQGIERLPPEQQAVGSNPIEGTSLTRWLPQV